MRVPSTAKANFNSAKSASLQTWHERLGHANYRAVRELIDSDAVTGLQRQNQMYSRRRLFFVRLVYLASNVDRHSRRTQGAQQHLVKRHGLTLWVRCRLMLSTAHVSLHNSLMIALVCLCRH